MKKSRLAISGVFSLAVITVFICYYFFAIPIYTFSWHLLNPAPIKWEWLVIEVPKDFISEKMEVKSPFTNAIQIFSYKLPNSPSIYFQKIPKQFKAKFNKEIIQTLISPDHLIFETSKCTYIEKPCFWVKSANNKSLDQSPKEHDYRDDIIVDNDIWITYSGPLESRFMIKKVLSNITISGQKEKNSSMPVIVETIKNPVSPLKKSEGFESFG